MKKFIIHILLILLLLISSAFILENLYTKVFQDSKIRSKIQFAKHLINEDFDVIILGSSRANNHFDTELFQIKGFKTFNFGMDGSTLNEALVILDILIHNHNKIKNVILEVDLNLTLTQGNKTIQTQFLPYLNDDFIYDHLKNQPEIFWHQKVPFYKYASNESKLGLRELTFTLLGKKSKAIENAGFTPLFGTNNKMEYDLTHYKTQQNKFYDELKRLCVKNNIKLFSVSTPMCSNTKGVEYFEKIRKIYPEIYNFEDIVNKDEYFFSCGHMNKNGAKIYTTYILNHLTNNFNK